jgi:hypothetical protein
MPAAAKIAATRTPGDTGVHALPAGLPLIRRERFLLITTVLCLAVTAVGLFPNIAHELLSDDVYYHLITAREMLLRKTPLLLQDDWLFPPQGRPHLYPPFFHWLLLALTFGGRLDWELVTRSLQVLLYPVLLLVTFTYYRRALSRSQAWSAWCLLICFFPFFARAHLAIPEAVEHLLVPLLFIAFLSGRAVVAGGLLLTLFLTHNLTPPLYLAALTAGTFLQRANPQYRALRTVWLLASPGILLHLFVAWLGADAPFYLADKLRPRWETIAVLYAHPLRELPCLSPWLILAAAGLFRPGPRRQHVWPALWLLSTLPILFTYSARFPGYAAVPMCYFAGCGAAALVSRWRRLSPWACLVLPGLFIASYGSYSYKYSVHRRLDTHQRTAFRWIDEHIPAGEWLGTETLFTGYRLKYYAERKSLLPPRIEEANWIVSTRTVAYPLHIERAHFGHIRILEKMEGSPQESRRPMTGTATLRVSGPPRFPPTQKCLAGTHASNSPPDDCS